MASVYLKRETWYARYKDATGRWASTATAAKSKTEARRLADDLERRCERQRMGLEVLPLDASMTLAQLCQWWLDEWCPQASLSRERSRLRKHVIAATVGKILLKNLTANHLDVKLRELEKGDEEKGIAPLAPASLNKLRATLHSIFRRARKPGYWTRENPMKDVDTRRVPKRIYQTLSLEEVPQVLAAVPVEWRALFATALFTGMRKGELFGLRKSDVDLKQRTIAVQRSYDRDTTKGGHADVLPISEPLLPFIEEALRASPSPLLFPDRNGEMRSSEADPQKILRTALSRAGVVDGYEHLCRRCKKHGRPHAQRHADNELRRCELCGMKLWPRALPRALRFQDLRHCTATLLLRSGVDPHRVQRLMRHRDVKLTTSTYAHLIVEDLREAANNVGPKSMRTARDAATPPQSTTEAPPAALGRLLSVREVAKALSVAEASIYKLVASGTLPSVRVLNAIRVREADVSAFLIPEPAASMCPGSRG